MKILKKIIVIKIIIIIIINIKIIVIIILIKIWQIMWITNNNIKNAINLFQSKFPWMTILSNKKVK